MPTFKLKNGLGEIKLKYIVEDTDRHGNVRVYLRRKGYPKIRMRAPVGTQEFLDEYNAALAGKSSKETESKRKPLQTSFDKKSLRWLCIQYFKSPAFKQLATRTQRVRRGVLDNICMLDGDKPYALMEPRHVRARRDTKLDRPESANADIKALRQVFKYALEYDLASSDPTQGVPYLKSHSQGFHSWTPEEVARFENHFPIGTKARLALALFLYTGQRRSDIVRLGPQHTRDGWLTFTQAKNRNRSPVKIAIPILPALQSVLDQSKTGNLSYLVTEFGKPFTPEGFGNWFRKQCDAAGLPDCSAHGLRKAGAAIAAENGATEKQLMAIFGWRSLKEVTRYTQAARQKILAESGMKYLAGDSSES